MSKYYAPPRKTKPKVDRDDDPFVRSVVYIPRSIHQRLEHAAEDAKLPLSRMICYALYNELETDQPFHFDLTLPEEDFVVGKFEHEAELLRQYLIKIPSGVGLEQLVLLKDDIGLSAKKVLLAYMELKAAGRIEEYYPRRASFDYHENYRYVRLKGVSRSLMNRNRFRAVEGRAVGKKED